LFYRHVLDNQGNREAVLAVSTGHSRARRLHDAFAAKGSLAHFHHDDRVFAIVSAVSRSPVATAVDSDWLEHETGLKACGVRIEFVCGREAAARKHT
jgi:hypothetical protein